MKGEGEGDPTTRSEENSVCSSVMYNETHILVSDCLYVVIKQLIGDTGIGTHSGKCNLCNDQLANVLLERKRSQQSIVNCEEPPVRMIEIFRRTRFSLNCLFLLWLISNE